MAVLVNGIQDNRFKIGWMLLLIAAGLMAINHIMMIFVLDESTLFIGYAVFNAYSLAVLYIPFRRGERWAWYATWILPIGLAAAAFTAPDVAVLYYSFAALCVAGLLLTIPRFFAADAM
ncbi:MAG: hypothetical protein IT328_00110 [Caldilineaceae bacterium]|nr:hypothetical protein [Caldilineaceae bacterium]